MANKRSISGKPAMFYHISFRKNIQGMWTPQIPHGTEIMKTGKGSFPYPEPTFPRIATSPDLEGCFRGVYYNVNQLFDKGYPHLDFHIYQAFTTGKEKQLTTKQLIEKRLVWDAHVTKEHDFLEPVFMKHVGLMRVTNTANSGMLFIHPFGDKTLKKLPDGPKTIKFKILKPLSVRSS